MVSVFTMLVTNHFAGALLFFPVVWLLMRRKDGQKLRIANLWLLAGLLATAILAGSVRFMAIYVIGSKAALNPEGGLSAFFFLGLPILVAIGVSAFLRTKAFPIAEVTSRPSHNR